MRRGTTPTLPIRVIGADFAGCTLYVTLEQGSLQITKTNDDLSITPTEEGAMVGVFLSQEETLSFKKGTASIQMRWINSSGIADGSAIARIEIKDVLLEGVIEYDTD